MFTIQSVIFDLPGYPFKTETVPLEKAWQFFEDHNYLAHPVKAIGTTDDGRTFETFAKGWLLWDFAMQKYRLKRIGLGAYGDGGPENPALVNARPKLYLENGNWVSGINHATEVRS